MRTRSLATACVAAAVVALVLAGCSGGGRDVAAQVQPAGSFPTDQATLATLNMTWLPVLFPTVFRVGGGGSPTVDDPVTNPDGSTDWHFVDSDGSVEDWHASEDGTSGTGHIVHPGGGVQTVTMATVFNPDDSFTVAEHRVFPDGSRLDRDYFCPAWSPDLDRLFNSQTGVMTLADGRHMDLKMWQYGLHFVLQVDGHEGWIYEVTAPTLQSMEVPDTSRPATGLLTRGAVVTQFTLPANPGLAQWRSMTLTAPGGYSGTYQLDPALTGQGTVKQNGALLMSVQWGSTGAVAETFADGLSQISQPSAAARDFLIDKWLWALGQSGPNPR